MHQKELSQYVQLLIIFILNQCFAFVPTNKIKTIKETMEDITEL